MTTDTTAAKSEPDDAPRFCVGCGARFGELHRACPRCGELGWTSTPPIDMGTSGSLGEFVPDTTSVDALRTRLARAFEVAALRDPSAELAAFEAAVRHEHGERIAKALDSWCPVAAQEARDLSPPP